MAGRLPESWIPPEEIQRLRDRTRLRKTLAEDLSEKLWGPLGMEGAFGAMVDGKVDENWAHEHHALWLDEVKSEPPAGSAQQPAE